MQLAPLSFTVAGMFDGAPGAFEVDVQAADFDGPGNYQQIAAITAVDSTNQGFHQLINERPNFVRLQIKTRTNAVNFAGWIGG